MNRKMYLFAILILLASNLTLDAQQQDSHSHSSMAAVQPEWAELMGSMDNMHATMASTEPSGNADVDFVNLMLSHHQAAVDSEDRAELRQGSTDAPAGARYHHRSAIGN